MSPLALDPKARFEVVLEGDLELDDPPAFVFRHLPCDDYRRLAEQGDRLEQIQADPDSTAGQLMDELLGLVRLPLVGWRGMRDPATGEEIPYDPAALGRILTPGEVIELTTRLRDEMALGAQAKKGSRSQSPSGTASSAQAATRNGAEGASGNGPDTSPSSSAPSAEAAKPAVPTARRADGN